MVILLPQAGHFEAFQGLLDAQLVDAIAKDLEPKQVARLGSRCPKRRYATGEINREEYEEKKKDLA